GRVRLRNGLDGAEILRQLVVRPALTRRPEPDPAPAASPIVAPIVAPTPAPSRRLPRPVFIVSPPRSGTSLLFEVLASSPDLHTIGGESHQVIESVPGLHPSQRE